ncbi:hypothetical protein [Halobacillus faecis]|uniref:Flagellar hook-length control protein-like C-terminal domain-containing protein n=1 Tax=Halobacillus faecis TaxID=360184 RepID=A0A511WUX7_9BACI|nr:hypothetical protein [Halobacillus faecis]GEN54161.1 hypothetical protein HFA01_24230 [Halobacillus faecis]
MNHLINSLTRLSANAALSVEPKSGQLIKGKVIQLLQDNKMVVNIGRKSVEVLVNQPLIKGSSYLFQVEKEEPDLVLRAVSLSEARSGLSDLASLLKQIGVKPNQYNVSFMKAIMDLNMPIHNKDLAKAFSLIQASDNQGQAREILLHMLSRKMPIRSSIYAALTAKYTAEFTQVLSMVEQQLGEKTLSSNDENIRTLVQTLRGEQKSHPENRMFKRFKTELANGSKVTFELFKSAGIINPKHTLTSFKENWYQQDPAMDRLPFTNERVAGSLKQLLQNQIPLSPSENQNIKQWAHTTKKLHSLWTQQPSNTDFSMLSRQTRSQWTETFRKIVEQKMMERLTPHLQESTKQFIEQALPLLREEAIERNPFTRDAFRSFLSDIKNLMAKQLPINQQHLLIHSLQSMSESIPISKKDRMWLQMKTMMNEIGFNDEHALAKLSQRTDALIQPDHTLKSLLLKGLSEGSEVKVETANRLINLINGTQLASYSDNSQTLQIALQFPGDFIGALKDVHMNMEGRKNDDGQIDSDYCHVMFYLHLSQLEETIIDLNIVERRVSVVIYNDKPEIEKLFTPFQEKLEEGLANAGYEMNSLKARVISEASRTSDSSKQEVVEEGVDVRI